LYQRRDENSTEGFVSVVDPANKPVLSGQKNRQVSSLAWHSLPQDLSVCNMRPVSSTRRALLAQRGFGARTLIRWPRGVRVSPWSRGFIHKFREFHAIFYMFMRIVGTTIKA
jgi:hypothetical protein